MPANFKAEWDLDPDFLTVNHGSFGATPRSVLAAQRAWQDRMERQPSRFMNTIYAAAIRRAADTLALIPERETETTSCSWTTPPPAATPFCARCLQATATPSPSSATPTARSATPSVTSPNDPAPGIIRGRHPFPRPHRGLRCSPPSPPRSRPNTRLAVIDHITSASAIVLPVQRIVAACHAAGVPVLIDGAHAPGQIDLDLTAIGADWYVGNCHKWLCAPKGCAFLHAAPDAAGRPASRHHFAWLRPGLPGPSSTGPAPPTQAASWRSMRRSTFTIAWAARLCARATDALPPQAAQHHAQRLNTQVGTTGAVAGAMATVRLPVEDPTPAHALAIRAAADGRPAPTPRSMPWTARCGFACPPSPTTNLTTIAVSPTSSPSVLRDV